MLLHAAQAFMACEHEIEQDNLNIHFAVDKSR
jgi:hypothetical protein